MSMGFSVAAMAVLAGCSSAPGPSGSQSAASASWSGAPSSSSESFPPEAPNDSDLRFMTGGQSGVYYGFGQLLARHATDNAGVSIRTLVSDGSKGNVESIGDGTAEFGLCQSDVMAYAYNGTNLFEGAPIDSFSVVAALYDEQVQIITCDPDIKSVADLNRKRVSIGAPNSGVYFNAIDILAAYGISETDITPTYQSFADSADALKNDRIDAAFIVAGAPTKAISDLSVVRTVHLVDLDKRHARRLIKASPYYVSAVIPAGTYAGQDEDVATVAVSAVLLAADTVPAHDVRAFVTDIFESTSDPTVLASHVKYGELDIGKGSSITTVPYHPGAVRFFKEREKAVVSK